VTPDEARAYLDSVSAHPGRQGDTTFMHPDFAVRLANSIQQARAAGMHVGLQSGYRSANQTGSEFDAGGYSTHSYGLGGDISGLGKPGAPNLAASRQFFQIASANGLHNPYGYDHPTEFNHWQLPAQPLASNTRTAHPIPSPELQRMQAVRARGGTWNEVWGAFGYKGGASPGTAVASPGTVQAPAQAQLPNTLTDLIAQTANAGGRPDLIRVMNGIRAGESLHTNSYDRNQNLRTHDDSWGPFQLNRMEGLGADFEKQTGLSLKDPSTIPAQTKFVFDYLKRTGDTSPWSGYKGPMDANPNWGNSGYDPKNAQQVQSSAGGSAPAEGAAPGTAGQAPTAVPVPLPYRMPTAGETIGQTIASMATAPGTPGAGGAYVDRSGDQYAPPPAPVDMAAFHSAVPAALAQGTSTPQLGMGAQLASIATPPGEPSTDPGSITQGAPGMTQLLQATTQIGTPAEFNWLDPRATRGPSLAMRGSRLA
jgi:hypothetical protein